jgi:hypothetical protein
MKAFLPLWMSLAALNSHYHYVVAEEVLNYQPEILESTDGLLEVTFQVGMVTSLNGDRIAAGYNGKPVGPTLRLNAGDTLRLTLENNLEPNTDVDVELFEYIMTSYNDANVSIVSHRLFVYFVYCAACFWVIFSWCGFLTEILLLFDIYHARSPTILEIMVLPIHLPTVTGEQTIRIYIFMALVLVLIWKTQPCGLMEASPRHMNL